jgi:SAM-dependent methyltransferase
MLPNDEEEHRRLGNLHFVCRTLGGGNVLPPLSVPPKNILDVGAGSGVWCIEVAKEYPSALIQGIDISPIDRTDIPENCKFFIANLDDGLKFDDDSMDLVNSRFSSLATLLKLGRCCPSKRHNGSRT